MEEKWPFLILLFTLLVGIGVMVVNIDRVNVMNNWTVRRCEIPIMFGSYFFKPDDDSRTPGQFASDNFEFCMGTYVNSFLTVMMAPFTKLFSKQANATGKSMNSLQSIRNIAKTLYDAFSVYLNQYYRRFSASVFQISRIMQHVRMAMSRMSAMMLNMIYAGLSIFSGMVSSIQYVIKVVLIICGILIVLMIILFFVMFPLFPLILVTLGIIISGVISLAPLGSLMDSSVAADAESKKRDFCFAEWTMIKKMDDTYVSVADIVVGDQLANGATVTAVIQMDGTDVPLYRMGTVDVSGSHLVYGNGEWKSVRLDERAIQTDKTSASVYCFNTTTNIIEIDGFQFRDWEEIGNDDTEGQQLWNELVLSMLNDTTSCAKDYVTIAVMSDDIPVKTPTGFVPIGTLKIGDNVVDRDGNPQAVCGIVRGQVACGETANWIAELYEYRDGVWVKGEASFPLSTESTTGVSLLTENGEFIIMKKEEICVRDFTEVGYRHLYKTYSFVEDRLRLQS